MSRLSISFDAPNEAWMQRRVGQGDYASKSEFVNAVMREIRERDEARDQLLAILDEAAESGVSQKTTQQIRAEALAKLKADGKI